MIAALALAAVLALAGLVWWHRYAAQVWPRVDRLLTAVEQRTRPVGPIPEIVLPPDLEARAISESEPWAQEQSRAAMREAYHAHGRDWKAVRRQLYGVTDDGRGSAF